MTRSFLGPAAAIASGWLLLGLHSTVDGHLMAMLEGQPVPWAVSALRASPRWVLWAVLTFPVVALARRTPPWSTPWTRLLLIHLPVGVAVAAVRVLGQSLANLALFPEVLDQFTLVHFLSLMAVSQLQPALIEYGLVLAAAWGWGFHTHLRERERREGALKVQLVEARLRALRAHLRPHFLFNALQAVSVLVDEDRAAARRTVTRLGDLLRLTLETEDRQLVPLREELGMLAPYIEIEQTRFHDRLTIEVAVPPALHDWPVPPLLLQPLVENAVRHGLAPHAGAGRIDVRARREGDQLVLCVEDDGAGQPAPPPVHWRDGVGLGTTRERLETLYGGAAEISITTGEVSGVRVEVRLPLTEASSASSGRMASSEMHDRPDSGVLHG